MKITSFTLPLPVAPATQTQTSITTQMRIKLDTTLAPDRKHMQVRGIVDDTIIDPPPCDWFVVSAPILAGAVIIRPPDARVGNTGYWVTSNCYP